MSFGQRFHIELLIVALVVGVLTAVFMGQAKIYLRAAYLVEPLLYSQELRFEMSPHYALTGRWPVDSFQNDDSYPFGRSISAAETNQNGDIEILLNSRYADMHGKAFDFILNQHVTDHGYIFNSWHCGGAKGPAPYFQKGNAKNEIPKVVSNLICGRE